MLKLLVIGTGGFIGALLRYGIGGLVHQALKDTGFPFGTLVVNLTGCLLIGLGAGLMETRQAFSPELRAFIFIGLLGSFTTFSTFGLETMNLAKNGQWLMTAANVGASVIIGLAAVLADIVLSRYI